MLAFLGRLLVDRHTYQPTILKVLLLSSTVRSNSVWYNDL